MTTSHPHSSEKERETRKEEIIEMLADTLGFIYRSTNQYDAVDGSDASGWLNTAAENILEYEDTAHQSAEAALLEKLQPLLVDEAPGSNPWYITRIAQNALRAEIRTALKPPKEEDK